MRRLLAAAVACSSCAPAALAADDIWNGSWKLDAARSSAGAEENAADGYVFDIQPDGRIRWEIPTLGEVVTGRVDGQPMTVRRTKERPGMTLSVEPDGPLSLRYKVAVNGEPEGEGRMTIIEGGKAWVDISWRSGMAEYAGELVYVRQ